MSAIWITAILAFTRCRAESRFKTLLESAPDAMVVVNGGGNISLVNAKTENLFGYSRNELLGAPVNMLVPPEFRAQHAGLVADFIRKPRAREFGSKAGLTGVTRDGRQFPIEISLSPVANDHERLVFATVRDITERKRAEEALKLREAQIRQIIDLVPHFIFAIDREGTFLLANKALADALGATVNELIGKRLEEVYDNP